ncbi:sugar transferase [Actinomycetospora endophytica]|uniref:sugar transferase n=1 Tax=Actinomycetospora endophytica TaxID=2291215 RepID=UPI0027E37214|nr:sugar transferase [Actinomycetospora endophytica]
MTAAAETAARCEPRPPSPHRGRPEAVAGLRPALDMAAATVVGVVAGFGVPVAVGYGAATVLLLALDRAYRPRITTEVGLRVPRLAVAAGLPLPVLVLVTSGRTAPWVPVAAVAVTAVLVAALHIATAAAERTRRRRGGGEPTLVVGAGATGLRLARVMAEHPELGLVPCGLLDDPPDGVAALCRGRPADLPRLVAEEGITRVVVAFPAGEALDDLTDVLYAARERGARVWVVPRLDRSGMDLPQAHLDDLWGTPLVALRGVVGEGSLAGRARRGVEVVLAAALLVLTGPVVLAAAALAGPAGLAGRGPAFFRQWRLSRGGRPVRVTKIRTISGPEDGSWAVPHDRITPWGRLLRRSHVDELPQLWGVVRGELALVGPRPERPVFAARFDRTVPGYPARLRVRAGLTGWAQVHGLCGDTPIEDRARFDSQYVEYRSPWLDAVILLRTIASLRLAPAGDREPSPRSPGGPP